MVNHSVTPLLFLGPAPPGWPRVIEVANAEQAVAAIESGLRTFLPENDWDGARAVLTLFGMSDEAIDKRFAFAVPCTFGPGPRASEIESREGNDR